MLTDGAGGSPVASPRLIQLAEQVATLFDRYAVYRPEMVLGWDEEPEQDWQSRLWHRLTAEYGATHLAARGQRCGQWLERAAASAEAAGEGVGRRGSSAGLPGGLPRRLHLFAIRTLPPLFVRILASLSRLCEVHLYHLEPCREYWGDVRAGDVADPDLEVNPLLASLGRLGRDFQALLEEGEKH